METKQLKDLTLEELKVAVYNNSKQIRVLENGIKVAEQEIDRREKEAEEQKQP